MSNKNPVLWIVILCTLPFGFTFCQSADTFFSFTLPSTAVTSAGVYNSDSTLVRTLWSGVRYINGTHTAKWDGLLDDHTPAPANGNYYVEVLSNNVSYIWDGARIGNTSTALTGSSIHRGFQEPYSIAINSDSMYYCNGYHERFNTQYIVNLNNVSARDNRVVPSDQGTNQATYTNCTDGNYVYWGGEMPDTRNLKFVFATRVTDNTKIIFSNGTDISAPKSNYSGISVSTGSDITNLAVQKTGSYLFVARSSLNELQVVNKTTGELIQTLSITGIGPLSVDADDKLWLSHGTIVEKYTANNDGTLTSTGITLSGITQPAAISVSANNDVVAVADAGIDQQVVRGYSNISGGGPTWVLGIPGGYMTDATVNDNKFYFQDVRGVYPVSIAFQADGSFWVNEVANNRIQHYSASRAFLNRIMYLGSFYQVQVDPNNKNRLFTGSGKYADGSFLEFLLDYTKPLDNGQNGSWILSKNWGAKLTYDYDIFSKLKNVVTIGNHTYALLRLLNNNFDLYELVGNGVLRKTKYTFNSNISIGNNGEKIDNYTSYGVGIAAIYNIYNFISLDGDDDPVWTSAPSQTITSPVLTAEDAMSPVSTNQITSDKVFYFQNTATNSSASNYHFAAFKKNNSQWSFKTSLGTNDWYVGDFPSKGEFDNGNGVDPAQAGAYIEVNGNNIIWTYRGEFWKQIETNYFNHFHSSGLFIGQFGRNKENNDNELNPAGNEGNMFSGSWVQDTPDRAYIFSGGEGVFAGVHRWRIEGLSTIQVQNCNFDSSLSSTLPVEDTTLMAGLVHGVILTDSNGWAISHPSTNYNPSQTSWFVQVGRKTPSKYGLQDVSAYYFQQGGADKIRTVTRNLGTNTGLNTWKLMGKISFDGSHVSNTGGQGGACYFEVLDQAGKTITRFNEEELSRHSGISYVRGNTVDLNTYENPYERQVDASKFEPFQISNNNGTLTFQYANYAAITPVLAEAGADISTPTTIQLHFTPGDYPKEISVAELRFTKDTANYYRTKGSGDWSDLNIWESSADSVTWNDATTIPNSNANTVTIRTGHIVIITTAAAVDQLRIQSGATLKVAANASLWINDAAGDDVIIAPLGNLTIESDSSGTGRIGNSLGTINGNVVVEKYISSRTHKAYRLLAASVNTSGAPKPYIRDNWQEGQNNTNVLINNNTVPNYGTHITGSLLGANGFDATALATPSLMYYNQTAAIPAWQPVANTNATNLDAKKGYLLYIRGDRSSDLQTNLLSSNTTLRTTGKVLLGTQTFTGLESNGRLSLITNPYPSTINWNTMATDLSTANSTNFENYCTYWDPNMGENGGYVTISVNGTKSIIDNKATEIPSGEAFFVKAKLNVTAPTFIIKESHKSSPGNMSAYRTAAQAQFATSLYYSTPTGLRVRADAVNAVFDSSLSANVDGNDAEEIPNDNENIALIRSGKMLSIEARPLIGNVDTLFLRTQRLKVQMYQWQFQPIAFARPNLKAYLEDKYLNTRTEINFSDSAITVIPFMVTLVPGSAATDRFRVVFAATINISLPITLQSLKAYQKGTGIQVDWITDHENNVDRYEIEKSVDGQKFIKEGTVLPNTTSSFTNSYNWFDPYPKEGNNYYRIKTIQKNGTVTYSSIVNVKIGSKKAGFEIYPNPVSGNTITIQLDNIGRGSYNISLVNAIGQKVYSRILNHSGGSASQSMVVADNLPIGTYYLQITGNGLSYNKKIVK